MSATMATTLTYWRVQILNFKQTVTREILGRTDIRSMDSLTINPILDKSGVTPFKQPSSILRVIHIFGNQRRPLIANFMARLNAVNGQKGYIVVLLRNTQCASLRIAYKNIFLWKKSSFHWNIESLLCKTYFSIVKYVSKVNSMHPRCEMLIWMRHIRSKMWKATDSSW